eukprot:1186506-Prorocentrum_minimum.AAC.1
MLESAELPLAGLTKYHNMLDSHRMNEIHHALNSTVLYGMQNLDRNEANRFIAAVGTTEQVAPEIGPKALKP